MSIEAKATIIATGGLTRLYARNSASINMGGDGYALALRAGAELVDMEFVQFFPIGHLAPRLVGMDPIMWDPFRYKLGGKLLNAEMQEFLNEDGRYVSVRDHATHAILEEVAAGRGTPHGGAWLSFRHCSEAELRSAFGPIIDRLAENGIDLTRQAIEVAPIAHYHMGGIRADTDMQTSVPHLFAAGEAVGGANGANRLSGNAITEAFTFGRRAGLRAAALAAKTAMPFEDPAAKRAARFSGSEDQCRRGDRATSGGHEQARRPVAHARGTGARARAHRRARTGVRGTTGAARGPRSGMARPPRPAQHASRRRVHRPGRSRPRGEPRGAPARRIVPRRASAGRSTRGFASPPTECALKARLRIRRGVPGSAGRFELHEVPFEPGQTVLDGAALDPHPPRSRASRSASRASTPTRARNA